MFGSIISSASIECQIIGKLYKIARNCDITSKLIEPNLEFEYGDRENHKQTFICCLTAAISYNDRINYHIMENIL